MSFQIAIDGPTASGKSTIAKKVAEKFNMYHIDSGLMYRAVTYLALETKKNLEHADTYNFIDSMKLTISEDKLLVNDLDISKKLREPIIDKNISLVSSFQHVREKLVHIQQQAVDKIDVVMDGRDIGTVVFPNADLKIFLTANVDERAKRRYLELLSRNIEISLEEVKDDLLKRDLKDSTRKISPLKKATDAVALDTTNLTIDEVVDIIGKLILKKKKNEE